MIEYRVGPPLANDDLDRLYLASWPNHQAPYDFQPELRHALTYVTASHDPRLVGFVRLAWDGGIHAFLLEPTVLPEYRRRGIGRTLVERAVGVARERGVVWVHVDFDTELRPFYATCGFFETPAGLLKLR